MQYLLTTVSQTRRYWTTNKYNINKNRNLHQLNGKFIRLLNVSQERKIHRKQDVPSIFYERGYKYEIFLLGTFNCSLRKHTFLWRTVNKGSDSAKYLCVVRSQISDIPIWFRRGVLPVVSHDSDPPFNVAPYFLLININEKWIRLLSC